MNKMKIMIHRIVSLITEVLDSILSSLVNRNSPFILVTRLALPRAMLIPFLSSPALPSPPIREDLPLPSRAPQPLPRTTLQRTIDSSSQELTENNERIYLNESESHPYASIDPDTSLSSTSTEQDQVLPLMNFLIFLLLV